VTLDTCRPQADGLAASLLAATLVLGLLGASIGSSGWENIWHTIWQLDGDALAWHILWEIRLPRTLGAWLAGALLGLAGAVAQGVFRNPLADPYLLGSASGAALGSAIAVVFWGASPVLADWLARLGLVGLAFLGAAGAVLLTVLLAGGVHNSLRLLLAGVVVGVVLGALRHLLQLAQPHTLQALQSFLLGSTAFVGWQACLLMAWGWLLCVLLAYALSRLLDALTLGEATAASLGLPLAPMRAALVLVLALATGLAVAHTGLVAFVGLAAPHVVRSIVPLSHAWQVWLASVMGGVLLLAADIAARWLMAPQELPVGVLTAILGGSYLLWLMQQRTRAGMS